MRSIEFKLDEEHRSRISDCLRKHAFQLSPEAEKAFARNIEASIVAFRDRKSESNLSYRQMHSALRAIWQLAWEDDVSVGRLRARICGLPKQVTEFLHGRARYLAPQLADSPAYGFLQWVRYSDRESLIDAARVLTADGAKSVTRSRGRGRRSGATLEPLILGHAHGAAEGARKGGRPSLDARDTLVGLLATDWALATGARPSSGRSDHIGFGELVHSVFQWIEEPSPDQALRRYWKVVKVNQSIRQGEAPRPLDGVAPGFRQHP